MPRVKKADAPAIVDPEEAAKRLLAMAEQIVPAPTQAEKRAAEKAAREAHKAAVLARAVPAIRIMRDKRVTWRDIGAAVKAQSGVALSVRLLKEAVGEQAPAQAQPSPKPARKPKPEVATNA